MNAFERFGIEHLSPSTCGTFAASPAMFVLQKVLKRQTSVGAAAHRGTAVEDGVAHGLKNPQASLTECVAVTRARFQTLTAMTGDPRTEKESGGLEGMVDMALKELRPYGVPSSMQGKVSVEVDGLDVPIIGFYDFEWERHGVLVDLKTTWACPSEISLSHARQVSLYKKARGLEKAFVSYNTPKRGATYELENADAHFSALATIGLAMQRFLGAADHISDVEAAKTYLAGLVVPDTDSFYFNDPMTRQAAFEIWGL